MHISNKNKEHTYQTTFLLVEIFLITSFMLLFLKNKYDYDFIGMDALFLLICIVAILLVALTKQIFEYDGDGEVLTINNRSIFPIFSREVHDEFPKYKVISYKISSFFFRKQLYIKLMSKKNKQTTLRYNISFLTKKEIRGIKLSLYKVIKYNRESR